MRLSYDGEPCPAIVKVGGIPQGCEGYSKTPQMLEQEKKGASITGALTKGFLVLAAAFTTYTFLFRRR